MACFADDIGPMAFYMAASAGARVAKEVKPALTSLLWEGAKSLISNLAFETIPYYGPVTVLERYAILTAGAYSLWMVNKVNPLSKVARVLEVVVPGYRMVKNAVTKKPEVVVEADLICQRATVLESRRAGSEEHGMTLPTFQAKVGLMRDGQFVVIGSCTRLYDMLVAPDHVLGGDVPKYVYGRQSCFELGDRERVPLATDLVAIKMTERELSTIGISQCRLGSVADMGTFAQIVGPVGKGTAGVLRPDPRVFGRLIYEGTTVAGYSGGVYTNGSLALGIHQMGGVVNGGYSLSYIAARLRSVFKEQPEASEDWLLGQMQAGRRIRWDNSSGDPDEVTICVNGVYSVVQRDSMAKAFGRSWETEMEYVPKRQAYGDNESGEIPSSMFPGASSAVENSQVSGQSKAQDLMSVYESLSREQRKKFRRSLERLYPSKTTNGQESVVQPVSSTA